MILSRTQMAGAEQSAFASGVQAGDLMEAAGAAIARAVRQFQPEPGTCLVFAGKGNNGGDVLVAARHLATAGWKIQLSLTHPPSEMSPLAVEMLERIPANSSGDANPIVVLDGLLGIGTKGAPHDPITSAILSINALRAERGAWVLSADIPSGLDADTGATTGPCVMADVTVAIGFVKSGLVADSATNFVGRLVLAELPSIRPPSDADAAFVLAPSVLSHLVPPRPFDMHKGNCGRLTILAGSKGFTGAARLCSEAAVRAGAGLVTLYVPSAIYPLVAVAAVPEVMVRPTEDFREAFDGSADVLAIGPGLGREHDADALTILAKATQPCVIDADALNAISKSPGDLLLEPAGPRLLTPHPGEMERLSPSLGRSRREWVEGFTASHPVTLLLKGARTLIGEKGSPLAYNTTGHPGMAGGGMGDVLTGCAAAFIAQKKSPRDAAMLSAWVCGHAAELALLHGASQESLRASDVLQHLGPAFQNLRSGVL